MNTKHKQTKGNAYFFVCGFSVVVSVLTVFVFFLFDVYWNDSDVQNECLNRTIDVPLYVFQIHAECQALGYLIWNILLGTLYVSIALMLSFIPILWIGYILRRHIAFNCLSSLYVYLMSLYASSISILIAYGYVTGLWVNSGGGEYCAYDKNIRGIYFFLHDEIPCTLTAQFFYETFVFRTVAFIPLVLFFLTIKRPRKNRNIV